MIRLVPDDELPLLGEPPPVEFANSLYRDGDDWIDFLADAPAAARWFEAAAHSSAVGAAPQVRADQVADLRELRDAVRALLEAALSGTRPDLDSVDAVNRAAAAAPAFPQLDWPALRTVRVGGGLPGTLALLASETIALVTGPDARRLRRCTAPGCAMLYVKHHPRRAWCNPSCGQRVRQARYYRRQRAAGASLGSTTR